MIGKIYAYLWVCKEVFRIQLGIKLVYQVELCRSSSKILGVISRVQLARFPSSKEAVGTIRMLFDATIALLGKSCHVGRWCGL